MVKAPPYWSFCANWWKSKEKAVPDYICWVFITLLPQQYLFLELVYALVGLKIKRYCMSFNWFCKTEILYCATEETLVHMLLACTKLRTFIIAFVCNESGSCVGLIRLLLPCVITLWEFASEILLNEDSLVLPSSTSSSPTNSWPAARQRAANARRDWAWFSHTLHHTMPFHIRVPWVTPCQASLELCAA